MRAIGTDDVSTVATKSVVAVSTKKKPPVVDETPITVDFDQLFLNEAQSEAKYLGKYIQICGCTLSPKKSQTKKGKFELYLYGRADLDCAYCFFNGIPDAQKGEWIIVVGRVEKLERHTLVLVNCHLPQKK